MTITNKSTINDPHINDMRAAIEHRATWFYLLLDEFRRGTGTKEWEKFARKAINRCGVFHGTTRFEGVQDLAQFAGAFANEVYRKIFEMDFVEVTPDRFVVEFHYCPLTTAWQKQGCGEQEIAKLCDIAMDGDRGMTSTCPGFKMDLVSTIASGAPVCRIVFTRRK